ncbi:sigma factor-like helix-turn-helix DNA-binding protein [Streptomyces sp. NPDC004284]|uniref:sigma factor-like helix-turn-helix DNA-binding protein n=1 Tax=Streptomyces sp. NPDC004284 TaxID=3364695 RepID=UPI0036C26F3D
MSRSTADSAPSATLPTPKERRRLREALALTEEQVAEALGVTRATVKAWETGRSTPRGRKREAYARLLGAEGTEPPLPTTPKPPGPAPTRAEPRAARPETPATLPEIQAARPEARAAGPEDQEALPEAQAARPEAQPQAQPARQPEAQARPAAAVSAQGQEAAAATSPAQAQSPAAAAAATSSAQSPAAAATASVQAQPAAAASAPRVSGVQGGAPAAGASAVSAGVRPKAAAKRAAKPPRPPAPVPAIAHGAARKGGAKPPERLKPVAAEAPAEPEPAGPGLTPEEAFDALYAYAAPALVHQTYLLTGRRRLSREAVERAFHHAWQRWPEVAVDADPVGWVRAAAYEYALSPWHRLRRTHKHPDAPPTEANRRALLGALLELPPPYRRTVLLYDGLGLDLPETAAETEASTPAAANRLLHAREVIAERIPELAEPEALHRRLSALVAEAPTATLPAARAVRTGSEHRARKWTRAVLGVTAILIGVTGFTVATAPTRYIPVNAPGETVNGVPVRGGPQKLRPEDVQLRDKLRSEPNPGPERLVPAVE